MYYMSNFSIYYLIEVDLQPFLLLCNPSCCTSLLACSLHPRQEKKAMKAKLLNSIVYVLDQFDIYLMSLS